MEAGGLSGGQETVASASLLPFCPQNLSPRFGAPDSSTPIVFLSSDFQRSRPRPPRRVPPSQGGAPWCRATGRFPGTSTAKRREVQSSRGYREVLCAACSDNRTCRFAGTFLRREPSDGLEPSTPSFLWRIQAAKEGLRNSACWRVFPATTSLRRSGAYLPRRALSLPQKPRTCPQYLSPDPRRTAPRPSIAPRRIRWNLARPRRSSRARSSHDCWQHREASAQMRQCS